jgi:F-type H+-transporting ATPase subunit b
MTIDWWTLALQTVNFLVLVWLLHRFLYKPVRKVIEERRKLAGDALAAAESKRKQAEADEAKYQAALAELDQQRKDALAAARKDANQEAAAIVAAAKQKAEAAIAEAGKAADQKRKESEAALQGELVDIAAEIARTILAKTGPAGLNAAFLSRVMNELDARSEAEKQRLRNDVAQPGAEMVITTAAQLNESEQRAWTDALNERLGPTQPPTFKVEPGILGGAELRLPHAAIRFAWADHVDEAVKRLSQAPEAGHSNE